MKIIPLLFIVFMITSSNLHPGVHPYGKDIFVIAYDINNILRKYGIRIRQEGEPGHNFEKHLIFYGSGSDSFIGGNTSYDISIYEPDRIPKQAILEIINYCFSYYESNNRQFQIALRMYSEKYKQQIIQPKPFFELKLKSIHGK